MKKDKPPIKERMKHYSESPEARIKCFKLLCKHVREGKSLDCFSELGDESIREFMKLYPDEFNAVELKEAMRGGKEMWETIGHRQAVGTCLGNSRSWYYNMANRYGWRDKLDIEAEHKGNVNVNIVSYASSKPSSS